LSIRKVSIRQVKAARALLAWSQTDLANASGVSEPTIKRLESQDGELGGRADTVAKIVVALESAGAIFVDENGEGPGVRLRKGNVLTPGEPRGAPDPRPAPSAPPAPRSAAYERGRQAMHDGMSVRWLPPEYQGREVETADYRAGFAAEREACARRAGDEGQE